MAFSMRACAALFSLGLLLGGCAEQPGDYGFTIRAVELQTGYQSLTARLDQRLVFSREAGEALVHGVPLTVSLDLELRDASKLSLLAEDQRRYVIRYLPLSDHYQLVGPDGTATRTFPRLRHALAALSSLELEFRTGALAPGRYEFRTRIRLDERAMPAPMRLPALLSAQWQHNSEWSTWPFVVGA
jgi:hypothetical protein